MDISKNKFLKAFDVMFDDFLNIFFNYLLISIAMIKIYIFRFWIFYKKNFQEEIVDFLRTNFKDPPRWII